MKPILLGALLAVVLLFFPSAAAASLAVLGAVLVAAASQPTVWAFIAGLLAWPRIAPRLAR